MPKILYNGIYYDSQLELDYFNYLNENNIKFIYHPKKPIKINNKSTYTPDYVCFYDDRIEIVELKGYNPYSHLRDEMIHNSMLEKTTEELLQYLYDNGINDTIGKDIVYKKLKYLKTYGFVDFDFKNPNTIANKRKEKINDLSSELKELNNYKKNVERYFSYLRTQKNKKLTKAQLEWKEKFEKEMIYNVIPTIEN